MAGINLLDQLKGKKNQEAGVSSSASSGLKLSLPSSSGEDIKHLIQLLILAALFGGAYYFAKEEATRQEGELRAQAESLQQELAKEGQKRNKVSPYDQAMREYENKISDLRAKERAVKDLEQNRSYLVRALEYAASEMPRALWFTEVSGGKDENQMTFNGYALDAQAVSEFIQKLETSVYFPSTTLQKLETMIGGEGTGGGNAVPVPPNSRRFSISAKMGE